MVLLRQQQQSQKRSSSSFVPPFPPPKIPKPQNDIGTAVDAVEKMVSILAEGGCTLVNPLGPPSLPSYPYKLHRHLSRLFSSTDNRFVFLSSFSSYIQSSSNLRRLDAIETRELAGKKAKLAVAELAKLSRRQIIKKGGRSFLLLPQR
ncbi:Fanconi anemia group D2 protein-like protein [Gossypium australe]|uniref:Fanconi anemia group D2 protein-like protein n=1 Tax=Gossypium australe TaxID=47621 RepID=A0A5B6WIJ2_9ROSI|nr:Fanconi anemia group D2 protein-like protein [Gossypium australe]